jgi:hypothetical protein
MKLAGRYIITTNEFKVLVKCIRIIKQIIEEDGGYSYYVLCDIYRASDNYSEKVGERRGIYIYTDKNDKETDWKFLTKEEFQLELL